MPLSISDFSLFLQPFPPWKNWPLSFPATPSKIEILSSPLPPFWKAFAMNPRYWKNPWNSELEGLSISEKQSLLRIGSSNLSEVEIVALLLNTSQSFAKAAILYAGFHSVTFPFLTVPFLTFWNFTWEFFFYNPW